MVLVGVGIVMAEDATAVAISLARQWTGELEAWIVEHGLEGYDPFDVRAHPLIRALQPYAPLRKVSNAFLDLFPMASRRLLGVRPTLNAKAFALVALAGLRRHEATGDQVHLDRALGYLQWLVDNACADTGGLAWGYPFDVSGKGMFRPAGTPVGVVSAVAGEAFALAYRLTGDETHRDAVQAIAEFFLEDVNCVPQDDGTFCFSYTTVDRWRVHNANLHAVAHLFRAADLTGDASLRAEAEPALRFSLDRQRADGSWPYGEWSPGEPYEKAVLDQVDHFHTGFVLRSLQEVYELTGEAQVRQAVDRGYAFYAANLFNPDGAPRITVARTHPINIHACTEGILCPAVLGDLDLAARTLRWTRRHMADSRTGMPYYRKYPWFTNRLLMTRWGLAWTYYTLAEYLHRVRK